MVLIDDLQERQRILLSNIQTVTRRKDLRGKQKGAIQAGYAREYRNLRRQIQGERLKQQVSGGRISQEQASQFEDIQAGNERASVQQKSNIIGARLSSLPGSIQAGQAVTSQKEADVYAQKAIQARAVGKQQEANAFSQQAQTKQFEAVQEQRRFNAQPSAREQLFGRNVATQQLGKPAVNIPYRTREGQTQTIITGSTTLKPEFAISSKFAGKASTVEGLRVSTEQPALLTDKGGLRSAGSIRTVSAPSSVITPPARQVPQSFSKLVEAGGEIKTTPFSIEQKKPTALFSLAPLSKPAEFVLSPLQGLINYFTPKQQRNIIRGSLATSAVTLSLGLATPLVPLIGTGFVATTVLSLGTGVLAEETTKKGSEILTLTPEQRALSQTPEYKQVSEEAYAGVRSPSKVKEFVIQAIPFLSLTRENKLREAAITSATNLNLSQEQSSKIAELVVEKGEIGEFSQTAGVLPVGAASEAYGSYAITKNAFKLAGTELKQNVITAYKTVLKIAGKPLAVAGAQEGVASYVVSQRAYERSITLRGVAESGAYGAVSALTVGGLVIGGQLLTKAEGVAARGARSAGKFADVSGNILDITEKPSDILANVFYHTDSPNIFINPKVRTFGFIPSSTPVSLPTVTAVQTQTPIRVKIGRAHV